jgi:hypothetical protein
LPISNNEFLTALFGNDAPWVHVTGFPYDPSNIPEGKHLIAWMGDYYSRYNLQPNTNQYFTISNFYCDDQDQARRRKVLFRHTPVIVLDDVKEKLSMVEVSKLPSPSWVLETSPGSEQWGYILDTPCTDRAQVENLLDGLVANGLAPDGKDPGMKGVTRYVRLPEGVNNKASKLVDGLPFQCNITVWQPFSRVTIEQLAAPFAVDLNAPRRESRVDGAAAITDHPLINIPEIIHIKEVRSDGRFDITCPWVNNHTDGDDSGSAVFTNADGSIGFKCHHGSCHHHTGRDLLEFIGRVSHDFCIHLKNWQINREFEKISEPDFTIPFVVQPQVAEPDFTMPLITIAAEPDFTIPLVIGQPADGLEMLYDKMMRGHPGSKEIRVIACAILKHVEDLSKIDKIEWHQKVADNMGWGKGELKDIIKDLRKEWYGEKINAANFYDELVFVKSLNQFYQWSSQIFYTPDAFQNSFSHEDVEAKKVALQEGRVKKVDQIDYAPKKPRIFEEDGKTYANTWTEISQSYGSPGDISRWDNHFDAMGWRGHAKHLKQWMAHTLRHPEIKINHMLLMGSCEGTGKDFILYALDRAMGDNCTSVSGEELLGDFNDHLLSTKYLNINEAELGDRREAMAISNKLKSIAASPPHTLRVNQKGIKPIKIRNIVSAAMTTNSLMPIKLNGTSRRIYAMWSDLNPRDEWDNMRPEWSTYWKDRWSWMKDQGGWQHVAYHLMYEVDLSDFNPEEAPPMTDFLRDIKEASKSPMQQTMENFIKKQIGAFRCDLLTASDMSHTLMSGGAFAETDMYVDGKYFTPVKCGMTLKELGSFTQLRAYRLSQPVRLWVIRNREKYEAMDSSKLYHEYERQMTEARGQANLQVVK